MCVFRRLLGLKILLQHLTYLSYLSLPLLSCLKKTLFFKDEGKLRSLPALTPFSQSPSFSLLRSHFTLLNCPLKFFTLPLLISPYFLTLTTLLSHLTLSHLFTYSYSFCTFFYFITHHIGPCFSYYIIFSYLFFSTRSCQSLNKKSIESEKINALTRARAKSIVCT